jgi:hypothetical protein
MPVAFIYKNLLWYIFENTPSICRGTFPYAGRKAWKFFVIRWVSGVACLNPKKKEQ